MTDTQTAEQTTQTAVNDSELMIATLLCFLLSDSENVELTIAVNDSKQAELYNFVFVVDLLCLLFLISFWFYFGPFLLLFCFVVNLLSSWTTSQYTQIVDKPVVESSPN